MKQKGTIWDTEQVTREVETALNEKEGELISREEKVKGMKAQWEDKYQMLIQLVWWKERTCRYNKKTPRGILGQKSADHRGEEETRGC